MFKYTSILIGLGTYVPDCEEASWISGSQQFAIWSPAGGESGQAFTFNHLILYRNIGTSPERKLNLRFAFKWPKKVSAPSKSLDFHWKPLENARVGIWFTRIKKYSLAQVKAAVH